MAQVPLVKVNMVKGQVTSGRGGSHLIAWSITPAYRIYKQIT